MRFKITLSYNGANFCGWQIQPDAPSVQQCLNDALSTLLRETVSTVGAGRTDSGVNAINYAAHFDCLADFEPNSLSSKLNAILPPDIVIHKIEAVDDGFHARFSARRREYLYHIHRQKDPFCDRFSYQYSYPELDFEAMNKAAALLPGTKDFSCFEKTGADNKTSICTVYEAFWTKDDETHWTFHIAADRFLRNMVRAVVGTLLEVGRGKRKPEDITSLLESKDRCCAGESVPGKALFLSKIEY